MNRLLILLPFLALIWSCSNEKPITFSTNQILDSQLEACASKGCPNIAIDYPLVMTDQEQLSAINALIEAHLGELISSAVRPDGDLEDNINPAVDAFVDSFQDYMGDFPDGVMEYDLDIDAYISYQGDTFFTMTTNFYIFTGGAHGYAGTQFLNVDSQTEQPLALSQIINNMDDFKAFAEAQFRQAFDISSDASINSTGFWFEDDTFSLPEAYGFTKDGFELIYNTYEISSYADGPQQLIIALEDMKPWLNSQIAL